MLLSRRRFLATASLLVSGAALLPAQAAAAVRPRVYTKPVPLSETDDAVLGWVKAYATGIRLNGVSVLGKLRKGKRLRTHILAEIPSIETLEAALTGPLPFEVSLYADGVRVTFTLNDTEYTIDNLLPADFAAKLESLLTRLGVRFAADGITWNPETLELSDPFGATVTDVLKLINPGLGAAALFETLLEGLRQSDEGRLGLGASFRGFRQRVLSIAGRRSVASGEIGELFVGNLPELTEILNGDQLALLLGSPLLAGVLGKEFGVAVGRLLAQFRVLRLLNVVEISDAAIYLAELLQEALGLGTADALGAGLDQFRLRKFRQALAQAHEVTR